jgi:hypothetical protein
MWRFVLNFKTSKLEVEDTVDHANASSSRSLELEGNIV